MAEQTIKEETYLSIIFIIISHVIIFLTGLFLGRFFEDYFISKYKYKNKNDNQNIPDQNQKTITAYFHKKFQVIKNNSQPINKNDISINLQNQKKRTKTKNPNFIALTILWSHFQACRKNMIGKNITSPWQK